MSASAKYQGLIGMGIYNGLQKLSLPLFGVISTMILAHKALSKSDMGVWALFLVFTSFIELIRQGLVKTSLIRYINHSTESERKYVLTAALFLNAVITITLAVIMFFCAHWFATILKSPALESMLIIFEIGMILLIPFSHFEWIMYGKTIFKGLFWTYFVRQGVSLLLMVLVYLFTDKVTLNMLVIFYSAGILAGTIIAYFYVKEFFTRTFTISKEWIKTLWNFGKYVFGTGLSTLVFRSADQMMLSPLLGSTAFTASQSISLRVVNLADIPSQVLADMLFPKSASIEANRNPAMLKYYYEKAVGATLCFTIPIVAGMLIFAKFIVFILAGKEYYDAVPYLRLMSFTVIFLSFLKQFGVLTDSTGKPQVNFITISFLSVLLIVLCYFLIPPFGLLGAAYALLITHVAAFIISQAILKKNYQISFLNCFRYAFQFYPEMYKIIKEKIGK